MTSKSSPAAFSDGLSNTGSGPQLTGVNVKALYQFATGTLLAASLSVSALGQAAPQAAPSSNEALRPFTVHAAQVRLHSLGMYTGITNGLWDQATQTAVERFQQHRGLPPSGLLDPGTLAAMGLSPNEGGAG
jgi:peptidoglycan hydrolase-like protein with peptidoglycan-binding domain